MTRIALIACSAAKLPHAAPVRDLYQGQLFRAARRYAEATCDRWYVLSALHGVVDPDQVLDSYDCTIDDVRRGALYEPRTDSEMAGPRRASGKPLVSPDPLTAWASKCRGQLLGHRSVLGARVLPSDVVVMLAGKAYAEPLTALLEAWGAVVERPLRGMGIGRQKQWLKRAAAEMHGSGAQMDLALGGAA